MKQLQIYTSPFTGRSREIKVLRGILSDMKDNGAGSFAVIRGEPGTGRTRILDEFLATCTSPDDAVIRISLSPSFRQKPYGALWILLDMYLKRVETYSERRKTELRKTVLRYIEKSSPLLFSIHPGFAAFLLRKDSAAVKMPADDKGRLSETIATLFRSISEYENGLVIIIDDVHFCDRASIELVSKNIQALNSIKCSIIVGFQEATGRGARSEYPFLFDIENESIVDIPVGPFDRAAHLHFCAGLFRVEESQADYLAEFIYGKTGGNPLMSREAALFLLRSGALDIDNGIITLDMDKAAPLDSFGTYLNIALKNADFLSASEKKILSLLAVLGMRFTDEWIALFLPAYAGDDFAQTADIIDKARSLNFIEKTDDGYRWPHAGVRDNFYQAVDADIRNALHLDIACYLEKRIAQDDGLLYEAAYHFMKSGDTKKAVSYAFSAGERAMRMYANESAEEFYTFCLNAGKDALSADESFRLRIGMAVIELNRGRYQEAVKQLTDLEAKAPSAYMYEIYKHLSVVYYRLGDFHTCEEISRKGLALLGERIPPKGFLTLCAVAAQIVVSVFAWLIPQRQPDEVTLKRQQGKIYFWGTLTRGYSVSDISLFLYASIRIRVIVERGLRGTRDQATSDLIIAAILLSSGHFKAALRYLNGALAVRDAAGDEWGVAQLQQMIGFLYIWKGDAGLSEKYLIPARKTFSRLGDINELCFTLFQLSELYLCTSRYGDARAAAREEYDRAREANDEYFCALASSHLSLIASETGDLEEANRWSSVCAAATSKNGNNFCEYLYELSRTVILIAEGDYPSARDCAERALNISKRHYIPGFYTAALILPAGILTTKGFSVKGFRFVRRRLMMARLMKWTARRGEILYARGLLLAAAGKKKQAFAMLVRAEKEAGSCGRARLSAEIRVVRAGCCAEAGLNEDALDLYERSFYYYDDAGLTDEADRILSLMEAIRGADSRIAHITATRRVSILKEAQDLYLLSGGTSLLRGLLDICMRYVRASEGCILLAGEDDAMRLTPAVSVGNADRFTRLARDVYIGEKCIVERDESLIGMPVMRGDDVFGALCLFGSHFSSMSSDDENIISAVLAFAARTRGIDTEKTADSGSVGDKKAHLSGSDDVRLNKVLDYIRENYRDDISREGLASLAGMHPDNLGKPFKLSTGKKIGDYINDLRIEQAMENLSGTDMPVIDIAFSVGFESLRTFNRAFSSYAGVTPSEYRMSARNRKEIW